MPGARVHARWSSPAGKCPMQLPASHTVKPDVIRLKGSNAWNQRVSSVIPLTNRSEESTCLGALWALGGRGQPDQTNLTHASQHSFANGWRHAFAKAWRHAFANAWRRTARRRGKTCSITTRHNPSPAAQALHPHTVTAQYMTPNPNPNPNPMTCVPVTLSPQPARSVAQT